MPVVVGVNHPHSSLCTIASATRPTLTTANNAPGTSTLLCAVSSRLSRRNFTPIAAAIRHTGTLTKKTARQLKRSINQPPITGPMAADNPPTAPQIPMAALRRSTGNSGKTSASEAGERIAPPMAWMTREAMSISGFCAMAQRADPMANNTRPRMKAFLRP